MNAPNGEGQRNARGKAAKELNFTQNISSGVRGRSDAPTEEPVSVGRRVHSVGHWVAVNEKRGCQGGVLGDTS